MSQYTDEFLVDIARIVEEHGTDQLNMLAHDLTLGDPENLQNLRDELERAKHGAFQPLEQWVINLAESGSEPPDSEIPSSVDWTEEGIYRISATNPYADIAIPELRNPRAAKIYGDILKVLMSYDHFRSYWANTKLARELDIPVSQRDDRKRLMEKIIVRLSDMDTFELSQARVRIREIITGKPGMSLSERSNPRQSSSQKPERRSRGATFVGGAAYVSQSEEYEVEDDEAGDEEEPGGLGDWLNF